MLLLERFCDHEKMGVFGIISHDGQQICHSVEQPWDDNKPFHSCVPDGVYDLVPFHSDQWGETYALSNPDLGVFIRIDDMIHSKQRYACLIHLANWARDVSGCVGPGSDLSAASKNHSLPVEWMVTESRTTTQKLIDIIKARDIKKIAIVWK
jgi:hypothetical protein